MIRFSVLAHHLHPQSVFDSWRAIHTRVFAGSYGRPTCEASLLVSQGLYRMRTSDSSVFSQEALIGLPVSESCSNKQLTIIGSVADNCKRH
jgi:hypothetical protein